MHFNSYFLVCVDTRMSGYLCPALLLLFSLLCCMLCGSASAERTNMDVELSWRGLVSPYRRKAGRERCVFRNFWSSLVGTNNSMIAFAHIIHPDCRRYIVTKYLETDGDNWGENAIEYDGRNWKGELALITHDAKTNVFASVAKGNKVYLLLVRMVADNYTNDNFPDYAVNKKWKFKVAYGNIIDAGNATGKQIEWRRKRLRNKFVSEDTQKELGRMKPSDGFAFLANETFVFIFPGKQYTDEKNVFVVGHAKSSQRNMTFHYVGDEANCLSRFFLWGEKIFMVPRECPGGNASDYEIRASDDMGQSWGKASGPLADMLGNLREGMDSFTTITIAGRRVLLFTERTSNSSTSSENVNVNLFLADENHFEDLGPIFTNVSGIFGGSFYYANDELFFLSMRSKDAEKGTLTRLKGKLENIKVLLSERYGVTN